MNRSPRSGDSGALGYGLLRTDCSRRARGVLSAMPQGSLLMILMVVLIGAGLVTSTTFLLSKRSTHVRNPGARIGFIILFAWCTACRHRACCATHTSSTSKGNTATNQTRQAPALRRVSPRLCLCHRRGRRGPLTPLLSLPQLLWVAQAVRSARPVSALSDFLVFGLGHDTEVWTAVNCGGATVFFENLDSWIKEATAKLPGLAVSKVTNTSDIDAPDPFFTTPTEPLLPAALDGACFDLVLVDAPMGGEKGARLHAHVQPLYYAINMARRCRWASRLIPSAR
jgi:hypothetical protein